ncbi:MAG: hypothetical protein ABI865_09990, partial [Nitrosospira sp.]
VHTNPNSANWRRPAMESWLLALLTQAGSSMSRGRTAAPTYARLAIDVAGGSSSVAKRLDDKRQAWLPGARGCME